MGTQKSPRSLQRPNHRSRNIPGKPGNPDTSPGTPDTTPDNPNNNPCIEQWKQWKQWKQWENFKMLQIS